MVAEDSNARQRASDRAEQVLAAWAARGQDGPYVIQTRAGEVILERVERVQEEDLTYVEVWAGGSTQGGDPHFQVINPPVMVEDPAGSVEMGGRRFRVDPLAALADAVAGHGGAQRGR